MTVEVATVWHAGEHSGETYFFCCPACKRKFDKEPEKHAAHLTA